MPVSVRQLTPYFDQGPRARIEGIRLLCYDGGMKLGRNDACHCGSGKKYKKCHEAADEAKESAELAAIQAKAEAEKAAADAEAEAADPDATAAAKKAGARTPSHTAKPKERITTAANPIRRRAV